MLYTPTCRVQREPGRHTGTQARRHVGLAVKQHRRRTGSDDVWWVIPWYPHVPSVFFPTSRTQTCVSGAAPVTRTVMVSPPACMVFELLPVHCAKSMVMASAEHTHASTAMITAPAKYAKSPIVRIYHAVLRHQDSRMLRCRQKQLSRLLCRSLCT